MQAQAAALGPYVRVVEEASTDLLGADSARLFLVGRDRALALLLAATGLEVGPSTPPDPAAVGAAALELWVLAEGGEEPVSTAAPWYLEKQPPLQSRGPAMAAVWDHLRRWLPLLGLAEDRQGRLLPRGAATPGLGRENGEMEADPDLTMDIRWPHGAADARRGRQPPVMSVPIFLPAAPHQQPVALSDALVGVLVVERTLPLGDEPSARPFTPGDAELAAQWSLRLAGLLGGLVREGFFRSHALARQRQAKLGLLCRRLATARTRQAFQRWRRNARLDARDHATATQGQAAAARAAHARVLHLLAACVECVAGLGPVAAEEEDTEVLLGELEQLVWQRLPAALPAQRCTLTLLRPGEERKQLKAAGGGSSGSNGSNGGGGILLSKPVLTPSGDLAGLLEAAVDDAGAVAAIEEVDRALGLGAQLIGGLAALLRELGAAREKHGEAGTRPRCSSPRRGCTGRRPRRPCAARRWPPTRAPSSCTRATWRPRSSPPPTTCRRWGAWWRRPCRGCWPRRPPRHRPRCSSPHGSAPPAGGATAAACILPRRTRRRRRPWAPIRPSRRDGGQDAGAARALSRHTPAGRADIEAGGGGRRGKRTAAVRAGGGRRGRDGVGGAARRSAPQRRRGGRGRGGRRFGGG